MCATGLRHAPTQACDCRRYRAERFKDSRRVRRAREAVANAPECIRVGGLLHAELELIRPARLGDEPLLGALERQPLVVEQRLDPLDELEIATADRGAGRPDSSSAEGA